MIPTIIERRVVDVPAGIAWAETLNCRVYSCPDTPPYEFVFGATCLLLKKGTDGPRVLLNVEVVETCNPHAPDFLQAVPSLFRGRLESYVEAVDGLPHILAFDGNHRFYFLSNEPWPIWLQQLTTEVSDTEWTAILSICANPDRFIEWPKIGTLLWPGCTRDGGEQIHHYPAEVAERLRRLGFNEPDERSNGPAIMSFLAAGGRRPVWGKEGWPIHHIYDGTAPIIGNPPVVHPEAHGGLHAVQGGRFFTHSSGLVAVHPVAHHLAHHSALLKWLLRREAFIRFGFDPMGVFS